MASQLVSTLFTTVRTNLRANKSATVYEPALMVAFYNRALEEIWPVLAQLGAGILVSSGNLVGDGVAQDFVLPADFRAFVGVYPRVPLTATSNYTRGTPLPQTSELDSAIAVTPTTAGTPTCFALVIAAGVQYLRFSTIPASGYRYDYAYYPAIVPVAESTISETYTPWLGLCDALIARTLEEWCREGLEFTTAKRSLWRARAEADLALLLGLRHLPPRKSTPSMWSSRGSQ